MKFFKKIKDERLMNKQLRNIRIAFYFQNLGIIGVLIYYGIRHGFENITQDPLWIVWVLTGALLGYLQMGISLDMFPETKKRKSSYYEKVFLSLAIGVIVGIVMALSGSPTRDSLITGSVFFICFLASYSTVHYLRWKRSQDSDD